MTKMTATIRPCLQPSPRVLVSCRGLDGANNALAVGYCCNCSFDPPMLMVGIVPSRHSYKLIKESGCFVVNLPGKKNRALFDYLGSHSGRDGDKLAAIGASLKEAVKINAPLLDDCPVNIECKIVDSIVTGSHEMFAGQIEFVHAAPEMVNEKGDLNFAALDLL